MAGLAGSSRDAAGKALRIGSLHDLVALIDADLGVGFLPTGAPRHKSLSSLRVNGLNTRRQISLYTVAGRQRSIASEALIKLLRARDWSHAAGQILPS